MNAFIDSFIDKYPWLSFFAVWLLWICGLLWEYQTHRNKNVLRGGLFFLICFMAFAATRAEDLGDWKWLLAICVMGLGLFALKVIGKDTRKKDT